MKMETEIGVTIYKPRYAKDCKLSPEAKRVLEPDYCLELLGGISTANTLILGFQTLEL